MASTSILHVGVLPFPFGSHVPPLVALLHQLARSAPQTCFSFFNLAHPSNSLLDCLDNVRVYQVWDGITQPFSGTYFEAVGLFLKASPGNFEPAIQEAERDSGLGTGCLICDAFMSFACDQLAEKRRIPWVAFWASGSFSLSAHVYTREIVQSLESTGIGESRDGILQFIPPGLPPQLQLSDLPAEIFMDKNLSPFALAINAMVEKFLKSVVIVLNSYEEMDPVISQDLKLKFKHVLNIRPVSLVNPTPPCPHDKTGCLPWLDNQTRPRSVIYISFGSFSNPPENELVALAEALEAYNTPFLWSLNDEAKKCLPERFLQRSQELGKIVSWAPQVHILRHASIGVFINHGGWNSILESIRECVPMICQPFFGDQKMNSLMVEASWRIGVRVKGTVFSKGGVIEALDRVMKSEYRKVLKKNIEEMKQKMVEDVGSDGISTKNFNKLLDIVAGGTN